MNKWISVKDRLPEDGQHILAYHHSIVEKGMYSYCDGLFMFPDGWAKAGEGNDWVSYWMPLPEPPK